MNRWSDFDWPAADGVDDGPRPAGNGRGVRGTACVDVMEESVMVPGFKSGLFSF
jgi:hypothetical protein